MAQQPTHSQVLMDEFSKRTHLSTPGAPKRYLWTDAFAVCNFLALHKNDAALALIRQVHHVLGKHRSDDSRSGWISGKSEEEGAAHPTVGGLRIGKPLRERAQFERSDPELEWEQDGQYLHYLTRWIHALDQTARATHDPVLLQWAFELADAAFSSFFHTHGQSDNEKALYWKMSIDLNYPLVLSMGHHDAMDALITFKHLQATAAVRFPGQQFIDLSSQISKLAAICDQMQAHPHHN
eukprot:CAMPEP_0171712016 /NCGR_PEP_ID=MMETSP0991-20121206/16937_1 /TAXON_ID=483369 /ORGANISM="non described non described, Strain CCMP2098" /LENGTH=237 /DNA_ID=CAMNT_0012302463 /DNA_START=252 /DNA_END=965 /DNA_ORIENTATION=+